MIYTAEDGLTIRYSIDRPETWQAGDPVMVLLTGRAECMEKYDEVTGRLLDFGFLVVRKDWRGQGGSGRMLSDGQKGHVTDFSLYLNDLNGFLDEIVMPLSDGPLHGMGHSMGGHVLARYLVQNPKRFASAVLVSPMFGIDTRPFPPFLAKSVARLAVYSRQETAYIPNGGPWEEGRAFAENPLTRDRAAFEKFQTLLQKNPFLQLGDPTFGWLDAAFRSMELFEKEIRQGITDCPVFLAWAGADTVVEITANAKEIAAHCNWDVMTLESACHEILMEIPETREAFWNGFRKFYQKAYSMRTTRNPI